MSSHAGGSGPDGTTGAGMAHADAIRNGARLAALYELGLLDTPPEDEFDRYTRLATELLGVPVSGDLALRRAGAAG